MRHNGAWTDERDAALILLFEAGTVIQRIAFELHRDATHIIRRLRTLGFSNEAIAEQDTEICCAPTDYKTDDHRFQTAMRKAKNAGLENPPAMTFIRDERPLTYEFRRFIPEMTTSGCGSSAFQCAEMGEA